jgi:hypothetical protein
MNNMPNNIQIGVDNKILPNVTLIKFIGLTTENSLNCKKHIEQLTTKLGKACYALKSRKPYLPTQTLTLSHSTVVYGLIFWGQLNTRFTDLQNTKESNQNYNGKAE